MDVLLPRSHLHLPAVPRPALPAGEKLVQVRLLARGGETVLGDAASVGELFLTTDLETRVLAAVTGAVAAKQLARDVAPANRLRYAQEDAELRQVGGKGPGLGGALLGALGLPDGQQEEVRLRTLTACSCSAIQSTVSPCATLPPLLLCCSATRRPRARAAPWSTSGAGSTSPSAACSATRPRTCSWAPACQR